MHLLQLFQRIFTGLNILINEPSVSNLTLWKPLNSMKSPLIQPVWLATVVQENTFFYDLCYSGDQVRSVNTSGLHLSYPQQHVSILEKFCCFVCVKFRCSLRLRQCTGHLIHCAAVAVNATKPELEYCKSLQRVSTWERANCDTSKCQLLTCVRFKVMKTEPSWHKILVSRLAICNFLISCLTLFTLHRNTSFNINILV